jgi:hypothetical protein
MTSLGSMSDRRALVPFAALVGVVLVAVAVIYFVEPAHALPSFFPGHVAASAQGAGAHDGKHGGAALVIALAAFALAWFASGPMPAPHSAP